MFTRFNTIYLLFVLASCQTKQIVVKHHTHEVVVQPTEVFSERLLKQEIERLNLRHPDIVFAQAVLESSRFKSDLFKSNNNMFGMKVARQRPTTAVKSVRGYAWYPTWRESLLDYAMMSSKYFSRLNRNEYLQYLADNYAEDKKYINKLLNIIR